MTDSSCPRSSRPFDGLAIRALAGWHIPIEGNPTATASAGDLLKVQIGDEIYSIPGAGGGTNVAANPGGTGLPVLVTVTIGTDTYALPAGEVARCRYRTRRRLETFSPRPGRWRANGTGPLRQAAAPP